MERELAGSQRRRRTGAQLLASGEVRREQLYAAALVLARLQDRGAARDLTIEEMCEVLGYRRRPEAARVAL